MNPELRLESPPLAVLEAGDVAILVDPETPNWAVVKATGVPILQLVDGRRRFGEIVAAHAASARVAPEKAWLDCDTFLRDLMRRGFVHAVRPHPTAYTGRADHLGPPVLRELWIHANNHCNLSCEHCLVSSNPRADRGLEPAMLRRVLDEAFEMGARRVFQTGGEPFLRSDALETIERVTEVGEIAILTNGTVLPVDRLAALPDRARSRLTLQISIDGPDAATNDPIRGEGSFARIAEGVERARGIGVANLTLSTVVTRQVVTRLPEMVDLAARWGVPRLHLMWLHRRGRALEAADGFDVPNEALIAAWRRTLAACREHGVVLDNHESMKLRLNQPPGTRWDLSGAGWESACVSYDGRVYPSAALAGIPRLACGDLSGGRSLAEVWRESPVLADLRRATVARKTNCSSCHFKFLCGGGDVEHTWFAGLGPRGESSFLGPDPYSSLYQAMIADALLDLAGVAAGGARANRHGFTSPVVLTSMGDGGTTCATQERATWPGEIVVRTLSSNCVLSVHLDEARAKVREFYGAAAEKPQASLCCPTSYAAEDVAHVPPEVVERFYGCGSPIADAAPAPGETVVDLGSGAGIDCFIAARRVGPTGRVLGVDMTDRMLEVARGARSKVAAALGYDVVEFRKGFLEEIPVDDGTADLVTSNCVINLSPDKTRVFREIWRVLADHGRLVVSDIVCERSVPASLRTDPRLWGECLGGALSQEEFLAALEKEGFHGIEVIKRFAWKRVDGYDFSSITVRGYKFEKKQGCVFDGQWAIYHGPFKGVLDEEGHLFPREEPVEVCTDTAARLSRPPHAGRFTIVRAGEPVVRAVSPDDAVACSPSESGCCA